MQSVADVIYSHVNHVEPVETEMIDMFFMSIRKETQKTLDDVDREVEAMNKIKLEAYVLKPKYEAFINMKQQKLGSCKLWSETLWEAVNEQFMERYIKK